MVKVLHPNSQNDTVALACHKSRLWVKACSVVKCPFHQPTVIELEDPVVQIKQEIPEAVLHEPEETSWKSKN